MKSQPESKAAVWSADKITTTSRAVFCIVTVRNKVSKHAILGRKINLCHGSSPDTTNFRHSTSVKCKGCHIP